jgi:predicted ArsR family transcriptional regulator
MTLQTDLFDNRVNARHTDPGSSAAADAEHKATGKRQRSLDRVLALLAAHPESTSRELAAVSGLCRYEVARRTADLKRLGLAAHSARPREDRAGGRPAVSWWLTNRGREALR